MMKVVVPDINLDIVNEPRICEKCLEKLHISYGFKASFLGSNESVEKLNLLIKDLENADELSCVFCNAQFYEELGEESIHFKDVVDKCFPNMDYLCKSNTCGNCFSTLKELYEFTKKCLNTEDLISKFVKRDLKVLLGKIKLNVRPKLEPSEIFVSDVPSEVTDAAKHCVSVTDIRAIIGNGKVETPQEDMFCNRQPPNIGNPADNYTAQKTSEPDRPKRRQCEAATFSCKDCDYVAKQRSALVRHMLRHKKTLEVTMFECTECEHKTKRRGDLKAHMKIHLDPTQLPLFYCANCPYFSKRKCDLKQHVMFHMKPVFQCKHCSYKTNNEIYLNTSHARIHKDISEADIFVCELCPFQCITKHYFKEHMRVRHTNSEVITYKCNWCDFSTAYKHSLRTHMITHKSKSECEMFKCYSCKYESKHKKDLKDHIFSVHIQSEMFCCAHCSYKSAIKKNLRAHILLHRNCSEVTMHSCDICDFRSRYPYSMKQHKISHMRGTIKSNEKMDVKFNSLDIELAD